MRIKRLQKSFSDTLLEEEVKDYDKETKKKSKTAKIAPDEGTFK